MSDRRRPYRVLFEEEQADGTIRTGTVTTSDLEQAQSEAHAIARDGKRAEVIHVAEDGERAHLEEHLP